MSDKFLFFPVFVALCVSGCTVEPQTQEAVTVKLRILETSDLHANIMDYNYYADRPDPTIGLVRTASLIDAARKDRVNTLLVDNGDLIQGSPMGDYKAHTGLQDGEIHPVYKAMNLLDYEVGNIGNHEFNYGLDFLFRAIGGAGFPYINANVYCIAESCGNGIGRGDHLFTPYLIKDTTVQDTAGNQHSLKVGYIGFVPPQILLWDKQHLSGKVRADSIIETARKLVPQMKAEGADIIIAIPHSGIGSVENPGDPHAENAVFAITQVPDIDAVLFGHSHSVFPDERYHDLPNADISKGLLNGIPAVMPGRWGDNLGIVDFELTLQQGKWQIIDATARAVPIYDGLQKKALVDADTRLQHAVKAEHEGTIAFMERPIGVATADMYSFLAQVQDDPTVQIIADAQRFNVQTQLPEALQHLPLLSATAPFKAGGRHSTSSDADQYVQVSKGTLTYRNAADLYLYPNTVAAVKVKGSELKDWLECSANQFNQIDPESDQPQQLINYNHPTYNFDVIDGIRYQIDVTQPSKFNRDCELQQPNASRIVNLSYRDSNGKIYRGQELAEKEFIIATNNFRAFGGHFAGTGADRIVLELPDTTREVLVAYIANQSQYNQQTEHYDGAVNPTADHNWSILPIQSDTTLDIRFTTQNSPQAERFIKANQQRPMTKLGIDKLGFAEYRIDLGR